MNPVRAQSDASLSHYLTLAWRGRRAISLLVVICMITSAIAYKLAPRQFDAYTLVLTSQSDVERERTANQRQFETVTSLSAIVPSEPVVRAAVERIGVEKLIQKMDGAQSLIGRTRRSISEFMRELSRLAFSKNLGEKRPNKEENDARFRWETSQLVRRVIGGLTVSTEVNSTVIRIIYRSSTPDLAAEVVDAVTESFVQRRSELLARPGTVDFFRKQRERFEQELEHSASKLAEFSALEQVYDVDGQRSLLLKTISDLTESLNKTKETLADHRGQKQALYSQLKLLRPVTASPFVSGLVENLGADERSNVQSKSVRGDDRALSGDPPLLLVRVYQDSMVLLFKINAEISGLEQQLSQQQEDLSSINDALKKLSSKQRSFDRLKTANSLAAYNAEAYAKRSIDEQIDTELKSVRFSNLRIVQQAFMDVNPVSPKFVVYAGGGLALGLMLSVLYLVFSELRAGRQKVGL